MTKQSEVVKFPLGSSTDIDDENMNVLEEVVRNGMSDIVVVGLDTDGALTLVTSPKMTPEMTHFLLCKAVAVAVKHPLTPDIEVEDDEEDEDDGDESPFEKE